MELHKQYEEYGGKVLIYYLSKVLYPDLLVLSSPGVVSTVFFQKKGIYSTTFRIVEDADDHCISQAVSSLGRKIRNEYLIKKIDTTTHISLYSVTRECIVKL